MHNVMNTQPETMNTIQWQYGYMPCSKDDPMATEFWCPVSQEWYRAAHREGVCISLDCGLHWHKPVDPGEGWELVPEGAIIQEGDEFLTIDHLWSACQSTIGKKALVYPEGEPPLIMSFFAFRRRKKVEPVKETQPSSALSWDGKPINIHPTWVDVEDRFPNTGKNYLCQLTDGRISVYVGQDIPKCPEVLRWLDYPDPPPALSAEERAFEEWWNIICNPTYKEAWLAACEWKDSQNKD